MEATGLSATLGYAVRVGPKQAMVLAAGHGSRLGALGERCAKALVEIAGKPLLAHQLAYLASLGVERVVVNASHLAAQVEDFAATYRGPPKLEVVFEPELLGTAGGVANVLPMLSPGPLWVLYGDVIVRDDLRPMATAHASHDSVATLAVYHSRHTEGKGVLDVNGSLVTRFREKDVTRGAGWVNAGVYLIETEWAARFPVDAPLDFGFDIFPAALAAGESLRAYRLAEPVLDIGTPESLARASETWPYSD